MAGLYPDVPGHRVPYDRDGSVGFYYVTSTGNVSVMSLSNLQGGNDENASTNFLFITAAGSIIAWRVGLIFPASLDIVGCKLGITRPANHNPFAGGGLLETSTNSTNGVDGSWTSRGLTETYAVGTDKDSMRNNIISVNWPSLSGFRFNLNQGPNDVHVQTVHLYGSPSAGENPNRLRAWHPSLDQEIGGAYFDWGDVPRNSILLRQIRIKNNSSTLTANAVSLTREALTDTAPSNISQHTFSLDGVNFTDSIALGNLAPGQISQVVTVRRSTPANAVISLWDIRAVASAASWS
jgi:hypothetical protein